MSELALLGGAPAVTQDPGDLFDWPIITDEDRNAVLRILEARSMSGTDETKRFEAEYAEWQGTRFALGHTNGTGALLAAMYGCGVGVGDQVICPSITYWASALPAFTLGATVVFADIDRNTLCVDPADVERKITDRTKAIMVVHYCGHPADMDAIMDIARRHDVKVIEDVSHAHGGLYNGIMVGSIGDVAAMSLMSGKSLAVGEAGMLVTDNQEIYDRAVAWGHYSRFRGDIETEYLKPLAGLPIGGYKNRMHQMSAAVGRVQLAHYEARRQEILKAMNHFWDLLEETKGVRAHRVDPNGDSDMGGWYAATGHYVPEELGGLSVSRFTEAIRAEGVRMVSPGANKPLHQHPLLRTHDIFGDGLPTRLRNGNEDVLEIEGTLPVSDEISTLIYKIPWFKHYRPEQIEQYARAFQKVSEHAEELLADDPGNGDAVGSWGLFQRA